MTIQYTQFGVSEIETYADEADAEARYAEICADSDTTEAWLFDGPGQDAVAIRQYTA